MNKNSAHLKHKYVSKQVVWLVAAMAAIIAKAREDGGLTNIGLLILQI